MTFWVIEGEVLLDALSRAHAGEDPELLYVELWANTESPEEES